MQDPLPRDPIAEAARNWERHGWGEVAEPMAAVTSIMRAQQILIGRAELIVKRYGLTFARFEMLQLLSFARGTQMPMNRASRLLQVHPTSVTSAVDRLEKDGLVRRTAHPTDGRTVLLVLTEEGRTLARGAAESLNEELFAKTGFSARDVASLNRILERFRHKSGDFAAPLD
ncbi:MarR family winged helix-turn-helix transcriptional regulator [Galactobacter caseinivorans]|uniref:MarR family transcriptional regulator n=1 Tax=Galactobacter caseinivorans TaxID=2676123 RepID=A0A496PHI5_9MICC|nr:MarR family transcriptional regulator [Galactobacter caseinivorans]RKW69920.1 MarR family transcriptional regulator [Galactobacter caseinivorans]